MRGNEAHEGEMEVVARAAGLAEAIPVGLAIVDVGLRRQWTNAAFDAWVEASGGAGRHGDAVVDATVADAVLAAIRTGTPVEVALPAWRVTCVPLSEQGAAGIAVIPVPVDAEAREEPTVDRRRAFMLDTAKAVAGAADFADAVRQLAAAAVPELGDICLIDVFDDNGQPRRLAATTARTDQEELVAILGQEYAPDTLGRHPAGRVLSSGRSQWGVLDDEALRNTSADERHYRIIRALAFSGYLSVPLGRPPQVIGSLTLVSAGSGRRFDAEDCAVAEELAARVTDVLVAARQRDHDHRVAAGLQERLLPTRLPEVPGLRTAVRYLPSSQSAAVGGDFYDAVRLPDGTLGFAIGDVAGHDSDAAGRMGQLRSAARVLAGEVQEPGLLIEKLQSSWDLLGLDTTATAVFGRLDPASGEMVMASAGHPPPLLVSPGGVSYLPLEPSPPLGAPVANPVQLVTDLPLGSSLLLYTDGLVEGRHLPLDLGFARLADAVVLAPADDPEAICDRVIAMRIGTRRSDDVAVLAISRISP